MSKLTESIDAWLSGSHPLVHDQGRWFTGQDIRRDMQVARSMLESAQISPGDRVVLGYSNSYAFVVIYLTLLRYGAVAAPINPGMSAAELHAFLERSHAVAAFVADVHWSFIKEYPPASHNLHTVFVMGEAQSPEPGAAFHRATGSWQPLVCITSNIEQLRLPPDRELAVLLYTSGTTGRPKAVGLCHSHVFAAAQQVVSSHQLTDQDVTCCFLPLFHINAQVVALLSTCLSGGRIIVQSKFSASRFWPTIAEHGVTWVSAVPTVIAILLANPAPEHTPTHLRFIRSASAQLPAAHQRVFEERFGIPIIQSYGMTEAASQICVNPLPPGQRRIGSVGFPVGLDLRVVSDSEVPLAVGTVGEIVIQGASVITRYIQADNQNDFRDGWFHTGDLGYVDADGYVFLVGRKKEMINRAGEKISPYEVEDVIREHALVRQVAVIGVPDQLYGERVAAYVLSDAPPSAHDRIMGEILTRCKTKLSRFKVPSDVHIIPDIPVGPTGKIQRSRLRDQQLAGQLQS